jgi:exopolysaccharide production protein ExoY
MSTSNPTAPDTPSRSYRTSSRSHGLQDKADVLLNRLVALALLVPLGPVMLGIALLVRRGDEEAPVLFGHYRVSRSGNLFRCFKFRTMHPNADALLAQLLEDDEDARAEWQRDQKLVNDPRVTAIGKILRKTSLDELPQLLNVLRGEMRLVGPRPVTVPELERYGVARWHYLQVRPGMTGLWQVSGRNNTTYEERVALDRRYVEQRSLGMDAAILLKTIKVVLFREGAR